MSIHNLKRDSKWLACPKVLGDGQSIAQQGYKCKFVMDLGMLELSYQFQMLGTIKEA